MNSITTVAPPRKYLRIFITPQLACIYCKKLSPIANAERDGDSWGMSPVCAEHGYASREGKLGFSKFDEINSIRRFVIEQLSLQALEPQSLLVRKSSINKAKECGYKPLKPLEIFANIETYNACHLPDLCWEIHWPDGHTFVVWSHDIIAFSLWPSVGGE